MKKAFLVLMFLVVCGMAQAQCVATVKDIVKGDNGVILVGVEFILNGTPEKNIDWFTYFPESLISKTVQEKLLIIKEDVDARCSELIIREYVKVNDYPIIEMRKEIVDFELDKIKTSVIGMASTVTSATVELDIDGDSINDKIVEITANAQKTISNISN